MAFQWRGTTLVALAGVAPIGFGSLKARLRFYVANRPALDEYPTRNFLAPLNSGELAHIVANTSNHWRKLFNVYAKLIFALGQQKNLDEYPESWQLYRDRYLFQAAGKEALLFSPPDFSAPDCVHIVAGKTYAAALDLPPLTWVDSYFAVNREHRLLVSPYPDYRQLTNTRIDFLIEQLLLI